MERNGEQQSYLAMVGGCFVIVSHIFFLFLGSARTPHPIATHLSIVDADSDLSHSFYCLLSLVAHFEDEPGCVVACLSARCEVCDKIFCFTVLDVRFVDTVHLNSLKYTKKQRTLHSCPPMDSISGSFYLSKQEFEILQGTYCCT